MGASTSVATTNSSRCNAVQVLKLVPGNQGNGNQNRPATNQADEFILKTLSHVFDFFIFIPLRGYPLKILQYLLFVFAVLLRPMFSVPTFSQSRGGITSSSISSLPNFSARL